MAIQEYDPRIVLLPEELALTFNESISLEELESCYRSHTAVCGIVEDVDIESEEFIISLSNSIEAYLPFKESVIQSFIKLTHETPNGKPSISHYSNSLIGRKISVHITSISENKIIEVSRIPSLKKAYSAIMEGTKDSGSIFYCYVLSCSRRSTFVDMGGGILGLIPIKNLSSLMYTDLRYWIHPGDCFYTKLDYVADEMKFYLSRKAYSLSEISPDIFERGDMVTVAIGQPVPKCDGYFVEITPAIAGIMDSRQKFFEGDITLGTISKVIPDDNVLCGYRFRLDDALVR